VSAAVGAVVRCVAWHTHCTPQRGRVSNGAFSRRMMHAQPPHGGTREPRAVRAPTVWSARLGEAARRGADVRGGWVRRWGARYVWGGSQIPLRIPPTFSPHKPAVKYVIWLGTHTGAAPTPPRSLCISSGSRAATGLLG